MALFEKHLFVKKSTLPNAGKGLFTKVFIPKGALIIEYREKLQHGKMLRTMTEKMGTSFM